MTALLANFYVAAHAWVLPAAVMIPLAGAAGVFLFRKNLALREAATLIAGVLLAVLVLSLWPYAEAGLQFTLWTWLPGLSFAFKLEPLGLLFATVAGLLWPVTSVYSIGYLRANKETHQTRYFICFSIAICGAMGIALSANALTLFIFYEVLTLSTWPLVGHRGDHDGAPNPAAQRGARIYLLILLTTSIGLLLPALIWTWHLTGTTDFRAGGILDGHASPAVLGVLYAMFLFGTGKAALMPFHRWLPSAMVAPAPVSALLHAVAVVKAGVFTILKVTVYLFGLDTLRTTGAAEVMMWVAIFTLLAASIIALREDNLKARLAYSTISQLAYVVVGATLATTLGALGAALHIATHAVAKITLFFCAGSIYLAARKNNVSELDGLGRKMPFTFAAFFIAAVSIIGLPPLAGVWSKWMLMRGALDVQAWAVVAALVVSSLLNIAYLMPIPLRAFFRPARGETWPADQLDGAPPSEPVAIAESPWMCVLPLCLTALGCLALFFAMDVLRVPLESAIGGP